MSKVPVSIYQHPHRPLLSDLWKDRYLLYWPRCCWGLSLQLQSSSLLSKLGSLLLNHLINLKQDWEHIQIVTIQPEFYRHVAVACPIFNESVSGSTTIIRLFKTRKFSFLAPEPDSGPDLPNQMNPDPQHWLQYFFSKLILNISYLATMRTWTYCTPKYNEKRPLCRVVKKEQIQISLIIVYPRMQCLGDPYPLGSESLIWIADIFRRKKCAFFRRFNSFIRK